MENGECPLLVKSSRCKRRKISATRDIPLRPKGSAHAQCLSSEPSEEDSSDNNLKSNSNFKEESSNGLKKRALDLKKEGVLPVMLDKKNTLLLPRNGSISVSSGNGLEKSRTRRYPTRRAISAIRVLPPLCRRNGIRASEEESLGVLDSPKNGSFGRGKCRDGKNEENLTKTKKVDSDAVQLKKKSGSGVDEEILKERAKTNVKQSKGHVRPNEESKEVLDYVENKRVGEGKSRRGRKELCPGISRSKDHDYDEIFTRNKIQEILCMFRKLLQEDGDNSTETRPRHKRVDYQVAKIIQDKYKIVNIDKQILGHVPGVKVGDEFKCRMELSIIGLHRQTQSGINCVRQGEKTLATSIVASEDHTDVLDNSNILIYSGQGGTAVYLDKKPQDQKLESGNLALKNSMHEKNPIRVIRGCDPYKRRFRKFVYIGLYLVENFWQDVGLHGNRVFKFQLERIPGQPEVPQNEVKRSKRSKVKGGVCLDDISHGKEVVPIRAVNYIDDEQPPPFKYRTNLIYPDWCLFTPPKGCGCINGCSDSKKCSCAVKNGGEIPYNSNGALIEGKPLVYECGPSCKCPPSCHNRVSQHGIHLRLEIFKTKLKGWGLRSQNFIPSGSFICEYVGELLKEEEAEKRTGYDEYLFDIGKNLNSNLLSDEDLTCCEDVEDEGGFTIDAMEYGNVGRFINHSCSPNLCAQDVLFDHEDKSIPHIMFFAAEDIHPSQELTYDYHYTIDRVRDSNGNIRKKGCFCGSPECTGRLY